MCSANDRFGVVQISGVLKQIAARFPKSILFQKCVATTPIKFATALKTALAVRSDNAISHPQLPQTLSPFYNQD